MPLAERIISLIAPHDCLGCGQGGGLLCEVCTLAITPLPERCYRCQAASRDCRVCKSCRRNSLLRHVWVRTQYEALTKELIIN